MDAGSNQRWSTAASNDRANYCTTTLDTNRSRWQQWRRRGATMPNQMTAPVLQQVGFLIPVSAFSGEESADNIAPREIDFQTEDGID